MNKRFSKILRTILILVITGVLIFFAFQGIELDELIQDLSEANYWWVLWTVLLGWFAYVARGLRWLILIDAMGYKANTWRSIHAVSIGYFTNLLVPRAGEIARCTSLSQTDDIPVDKLFGTVIVERVIDFIILGLFILTALIVQFDNIMGFFTAVGEARSTGSSGGGISTLLLYLAGIGVLVLVLFWVFRKRLMATVLFEKVRGFILGVFDGMKTVYKMKRKGAFIGYTLIIWFTYFGMIYYNFFSLPNFDVLGIGDGITMTVIGGLGMVVPSQGGIGSYHLAVSYGMTVLGSSYGLEDILNKQSGLTYATLVHTSQTLMSLVAGSIALFALYLARTRKNRSSE
ncbi:flippase-like domain-containing protein [Cryomorphaceae bacterium]|nr:flippase-like domain-containing protein [Cryomorphaceae bacterium]